MGQKTIEIKRGGERRTTMCLISSSFDGEKCVWLQDRGADWQGKAFDHTIYLELKDLRRMLAKAEAYFAVEPSESEMEREKKKEKKRRAWRKARKVREAREAARQAKLQAKVARANEPARRARESASYLLEMEERRLNAEAEERDRAERVAWAASPAAVEWRKNWAEEKERTARWRTWMVGLARRVMEEIGGEEGLRLHTALQGIWQESPPAADSAEYRWLVDLEERLDKAKGCSPV